LPPAPVFSIHNSQRESFPSILFHEPSYCNIYLVSEKLFSRTTYDLDVILFFLRVKIKIDIVGGGVQLGPLGTAATNGLLRQPRVIMMIEKLMELLAGETEVLGENLPQCRFVHHKPHMLPGRKPGPPRWEASD
jgi:hypothetical protein